jgi:o-succinylbenzoate synthase
LTRSGAIDSIELREVHLPMTAPFETTFGVETVKEALLITLKKEGVAAYGECVASTAPKYSEETIASAKYVIRQYLAPLVLREELERPSHFIELSRWIRGNNMAVAAVEMALWDLQGKLQGKSLSELLGGEKKEVAVGVSIGFQPSIDRLLDLVSSHIHDGYGRIKIKIRPGYDLGPVRAIRSKYPKTPLQVDANSTYRLTDAKTLKELDALELLLIEQPLAHDDIVDHAKLQMQLSTPICLDESISSPESARKAIEIGACRIINIKPGRVRGLLWSKAIHDFCQSKKVGVWCGGMLETGIGRAFNVALATLPGFTLPGDTAASKHYFRRDIITKEFELTEEGTLMVPDGPGIGVELDESFLDKCTTAREILTAH